MWLSKEKGFRKTTGRIKKVCLWRGDNTINVGTVGQLETTIEVAIVQKVK